MQWEFFSTPTTLAPGIHRHLTRGGIAIASDIDTWVRSDQLLPASFLLTYIPFLLRSKNPYIFDD